jgi:hypothetical protein
MPTSSPRALLLAAVTALAACAPAATPAPAVPEPHHAHELHLPPVGPSVHVTLGEQAADVLLSTLPHEGTSAPLLALWKAAWPGADPSRLHFDLIGSDGFHPAARPPCVELLSGAQAAQAHIDIVTHDVSFDSGVQLPGCYRVKSVVTMTGTMTGTM